MLSWILYAQAKLKTLFEASQDLISFPHVALPVTFAHCDVDERMIFRVWYAQASRTLF